MLVHIFDSVNPNFVSRSSLEIANTLLSDDDCSGSAFSYAVQYLNIFEDVFAFSKPVTGPNPDARCIVTKDSTHTLLAHLVTLLPSFKQSTSPLPGLSFLHCIKSSLYDLHLAPMKKLAESNGAELLPISLTGGMSAGNGVVSIKVV